MRETVEPAPGPYQRQHARPNLSSQYVAPRTLTEQTIVQVWEELLGISPVGVFDKFFELGGHSLLAVQLISRLRSAFQVEFPVQRLFEAPTIAQLAESIEHSVGAGQQVDFHRGQHLGLGSAARQPHGELPPGEKRLERH